MTSRDRILTILKHGIPDRIGRHESPWGETIVRWKNEGLKEGQDLAELFHLDFGGLPWMDISFRFPTQVYEETPTYRIVKDGNGVTLKYITSESGHTPHWIDHTLKTRAEWFRYKERLVPSKDRIPSGTMDAYRSQREKDRFIPFGGIEAYELAWPVFGQVGIFTLMMDDPELVADIFKTYTDMLIEMAKLVIAEGCDFDGAFFCGDLGYRNSTLFSPALYESLLFPQHQRMCRFFNDLGKPVILHSCGRIQELIPKFIEAGFSAIQPLEAKAGQDVRELKKVHGNKITFFGNMDVRKLSGTKKDIEDEVISKLKVVKEGGGYIWHSDHSVPPTVSWENYCYAMELVEKYGNY